MFALLQRLFKSNRFWSSDLRMLVIPRLRSLQLSGFIELRKYGRFKEGEKRFEGGESRQIKSALEKLCERAARCIIEVKSSPSLLHGRETLYEFSLTQVFKTKAALEKEIRSLKKAGLIEEHSYPVRFPAGHEHAH
ncbi:MAG: hypothetical protein QXH27_04125 [Candidatus Micrarchaeia archaeon]